MQHLQLFLRNGNFFYSTVKEAGLPNCQSEIQEGTKKLRDSLERNTCKATHGPI